MKVIFVVGPTASGKSALAMEIAEKYGSAIINCDSVQCYQALDIGSAKPSQAERARLPHFLFDYVPVGENVTAGSYCRDFENLMLDLAKSFTSAVVVGGTGFYFQAIENGMYEVGVADTETVLQIEQELKERGAQALHEELAKIDPATAETISIQDHYRLVRSLEIWRSNGKTPSQVRLEFQASKKSFPYPLLKLGTWAERMDLEPLVRRRTQKMLAEAWIEEVQSLISKGYENWSALHSVGYKEVTDFILGRSEAQNLAELESLIVTSTLQLAKKQRTWFKRDLKIHWREPLAPSHHFDERLKAFLA